MTTIECYRERAKRLSDRAKLLIAKMFKILEEDGSGEATAK